MERTRTRCRLGSHSALVAHLERAGHDRPGDHGAVALHGERAVDGQAEPLLALALMHLGAAFEQGRLEFGDALALDGGGADDGGVGQEGAGHQLAHLQLDEFLGVVVGEVAHGQGDDAGAQAEQAQDLEVFAGLGLDRFLGGDDQDGQVDAGGPGEHVLDEALVSGHVDDAEAVGGQVEAGEADVDGDAARLLLGQAVAIDAGERLDERGLAVVDVAGGAEDEVACHVCPPKRHYREAAGCPGGIGFPSAFGLPSSTSKAQARTLSCAPAGHEAKRPARTPNPAGRGPARRARARRRMARLSEVIHSWTLG